MKRRQYLAGIGSVVGGASILNLSQSSCTDDAHDWVGKVEDAPVPTIDGKITLELDGYTEQDVSWSTSNGQQFGTILVEDQSCGSVNEITLSVPEPDDSCRRLVLFMKTESSMKTVVAQYILKSGDWVPIETSDAE